MLSNWNYILYTVCDLLLQLCSCSNDLFIGIEKFCRMKLVLALAPREVEM